MFRKATLCTTVLVLSLLSASMSSAQSASALLEKGIYEEETAGNLNLAIETYRKIVADSKEQQSIAAQAQFRLAQCLLKQDKKEDAVTAFRELVSRFPDQSDLVAKAKQHLPAELELLAPPWKSGERLTLTMSLPNGTPIGIVGTAVDDATFDGKKVWRMAVRRFIGSSQNEGVSVMLIDQATYRPIKTDWQHTVLGNSTAVWNDQELTITKPGTEGQANEVQVVKQTGTSYSNDQWFFGFRQLPLEIGYKTTIPIRADFTGGNQIDLEVTVAKKETVKSPAGSFECFRLDSNIQQTFWISDTPERYPVKFEAGGVTALLQSTAGGADQTLKHVTPPITVVEPQGWFHFDIATSNPDTNAGFQLVAPEMIAVEVEVIKKSLLEADERATPQAWGIKKMERLKNIAKEVTFADATPQVSQLAGQPGVSFTATHPVFENTFEHQTLLTMQGDWALSVHISGYESELKQHQPQIQQILDSLRMQ